MTAIAVNILFIEASWNLVPIRFGTSKDRFARPQAFASTGSPSFVIITANDSCSNSFSSSRKASVAFATLSMSISPIAGGRTLRQNRGRRPSFRPRPSC
jgi:hypothetical protein